MKKVSLILPYHNRKKELIVSLYTFAKLYRGKNLEIVIVDDKSDEEERLEDILENYNLNINLIRIDTPGSNPCVPINVGVKNSTGDIILLSSPEVFHINDIYKETNDFEKIDDNYLVCSCFNLYKGKKPDVEEFYKDLYRYEGEPGDFMHKNTYGIWYTHSIYRPTGYHFLNAISKENFNKLNGFDERYRAGYAFDDSEFRDRVKQLLPFIYYDNMVSVHVQHSKVAFNQKKYNMNKELYFKTKIGEKI